MKKYWLILCFLGSMSNGFAQNLDIPQSISPERKSVQIKIDSAKILFKNQPIKAFEYVESAIALAIKYDYRLELAEAYFTLGGFNFNMSDYSKAILQGNRAKEIYYGLEKWQKVNACYHLIGDSYFRAKDFSQATINYDNALKLAEKNQNTKDIHATKFKLADVLLSEKKYSLAEFRFNTLKLEVLNDAELIAKIDFKLGEIYNQRGDIVTANEFYNNSNSNALQSNNSDLINLSNQKLIENNSYTFTPTYSETNANNSVLNSLNSAQTLFQTNKDTSAWMTNTVQFADYYVKQGNLNEAATVLRQNFKLAKEKGDLEMQSSTAKQLYDLYQKSNQTKAANAIYKTYLLLSDSLANMNSDDSLNKFQNQQALKNVEKQIDNLERERDLDQQTILLLEKEKELNADELSQQRLILYVFGGILVLFGLASVIVYRNIKEKKRANQLLVLKSLRAQMNPHFIFNSLNSVNNFIAKSDERAANKYLSKFSKLMRQVLEHSQVEFISLAQEVDVLKLYIELEHERFKDQFEYDFEVDKSLTLESIQIPPMLIQPFIENAIWHGLRYKEDGGFLNVRILDKDDIVEIEVTDNGIGREKSNALKTINQKKHQSTGMQNVENRMEVIQAVFKANIACEIIDLPHDAGTKVLIKLAKNGSN